MFNNKMTNILSKTTDALADQGVLPAPSLTGQYFYFYQHFRRQIALSEIGGPLWG